METFFDMIIARRKKLAGFLPGRPHFFTPRLKKPFPSFPLFYTKAGI
jgi:hypothetical protein